MPKLIFVPVAAPIGYFENVLTYLAVKSYDPMNRKQSGNCCECCSLFAKIYANENSGAESETFANTCERVNPYPFRKTQGISILHEFSKILIHSALFVLRRKLDRNSFQIFLAFPRSRNKLMVDKARGFAS